MNNFEMSPQQAIDSFETLLFDMIRYCLSDHVCKSANSVVEGTSSPVAYAKHLTVKSWRSIFNTFGYEFTGVARDCSDDLKKAWVYDRLIEVAVYLRAANVRPNKYRDVAVLTNSAFPYPLSIRSDTSTEGIYSGLTYFKRNMILFLNEYKLQCNLENIGLITRFMDVVGNIDNPNWILHDPVWYKAFAKREEKLKILRGFLYCVMLGHISSDSYIFNIFKVSPIFLNKSILEFIILREDSETTLADINAFIDQIEFFAHSPNTVDFLTGLFELNHDVFVNFHRQAHGSLFDSREIKHSPDTPDPAVWQALRDMGPEFSPERVLEADISIDTYIRELIEKNRSGLISGPLQILCQQRGLDLTNVHVSEEWFTAFMVDQFYCSAIERRYRHLGNIPAKGCAITTTLQAHILLLLNDQNEHYGLSLVSQLLPQHIKYTARSYTPEEHDMLEQLVWAWDQMSIHNRVNMNSHWKSHLNDVVVRRHLRTLWFNLIEYLHSPWQLGNITTLSHSKDEMFRFINILIEHLAGSPTLEELQEVFDVMPLMDQTVSITNWEQALWTRPFDQIPSPEFLEQSESTYE